MRMFNVNDYSLALAHVLVMDGRMTPDQGKNAS